MTDYLRAQDLVAQQRKTKYSRWMAAYDGCAPELQQDVKHASELICHEQPPLEAKAFELQMGFDATKLKRWSKGCGESSLEYAEDGPFEIAKVIHRRLAKRGRLAAKRHAEATEQAAAASSDGSSLPADVTAMQADEARTDGDESAAADAEAAANAEPAEPTQRPSLSPEVAPKTPMVVQADPFVFGSPSTLQGDTPDL